MNDDVIKYNKNKHGSSPECDDRNRDNECGRKQTVRQGGWASVV